MAEAENLFVEAIGDERVKKYNRRAREAKFSVDNTLHKEIQHLQIFSKKSRKPFEPNSAEDLKSLIAEMEEVQAATSNKMKKSEPKMIPPVILPKATGNV